MKKFFIQFDIEEDNISSIVSYLKSKGTFHDVLGTLYCLITDSYDNTLELRDDILEMSENTRVFVMQIPEGINSAWHLSVDNSNWLKSVLNGK